MEMHSRQSLKEIHGISAAPRRQPRWLLRLGIAAVLAVLKTMTKAINAELAARRAILSSDAGDHQTALPPVSSPDLSPEGQPTAICRDSTRRDQLEPEGSGTATQTRWWMAD
jgi:hypothetical protein